MKHFKRIFATLFNVVSFFHKFSVPWVLKYVQKCLSQKVKMFAEKVPYFRVSCNFYRNAGFTRIAQLYLLVFQILYTYSIYEQGLKSDHNVMF